MTCGDGELLGEYDARLQNASKQSDGADTLISQAEAGAAAGMSKRQIVTAVRIANIPEPEFEAVLESGVLPTRGNKVLTRSPVQSLRQSLRQSGRQVHMDTRSLTYRELADALGVKIDSARKTVQRRRWAKTTGNDGTVRVTVPIEYLDRSTDSPSDSPVTIYTRELEVRIEGLHALVSAETRRADTAEGLLALMRDQLDDVKTQREGWQKQAEAAQKLLVDAQPKRGWFSWRKAS